MALKKSQLYSSLWSSCDELRGSMDASQYKDYILTLLFMKYVSDKYADGVIEVPKGGSFADMVKLKGNKEIGDKINKIIAKLAKANGLEDVLTKSADFNDDDKLGKGNEMVDRLSKLIGIFETLDFGANRAEGDDLLGDAYEYLMRHFATESGKSKGQFYTPAEVSRIIAKVVGVGPKTSPDDTIYDPTSCRQSGSLPCPCRSCRLWLFRSRPCLCRSFGLCRRVFLFCFWLPSCRIEAWRLWLCLRWSGQRRSGPQQIPPGQHPSAASALVFSLQSTSFP